MCVCVCSLMMGVISSRLTQILNGNIGIQQAHCCLWVGKTFACCYSGVNSGDVGERQLNSESGHDGGLIK